MALKKATRTIKGIILHCAATPEGKDIKTATIKQWHVKSNGWKDIGYHYVIELDGSIHEGRNINSTGAHCSGHNSGTIGICYIGGLAKDAKTPKDTRNDTQKQSLISLVHSLLSLYKLPLSAVHCHNEYAAKACPSFTIAQFRHEYQAAYPPHNP